MKLNILLALGALLVGIGYFYLFDASTRAGSHTIALAAMSPFLFTLVTRLWNEPKVAAERS